MLYRCSDRRNCGARRALPKPIEQYVNRPMCPACKRDTLRLDAAQAKRNRRQTCRCTGVPYPHNRGTLVGCEGYKKEFTQEDYYAYLDQLKEASIRL